MNSQGSALEENERWLDSIEGKTYQFTNALETMWSNMLNSEVIKGFIDFGTTMIKFLDTAPGKITAVVSALAGFSKLKGFSVLGLGKDAQASLQTYQQGLLKLSSLKLSGVEFDTTNIAAYANAVDGLTAKKQAQILATMGLNKVQIIEVMNHNKVGAAVIEETLNKMNLTNATKKLTTTTVEAALKSKLSDDALKSQAVSQFLAANGSKKLTAELVAQMVQQKILTAEQAAAILTTNKLAFSWKALGVSIATAFKANPIGFIVSIASTILTFVIPAIQKFHKSAGELKEEVKDIAESYQSAKETFESNITTLTTSSDTKQFKTLQDEFNLLAQGVDKYGNNISLTTDQYERYKEICQQMVGIQPSIAAGYDSATQAIGNNVNVLRDLIELQRIQARQNAEERVSDENFGNFSKDATNDYNKAVRENASNLAKARSDLNAKLLEIFRKENANATLGSDFGYDFNMNNSDQDDYMKYVLNQLGHTNVDEVINSYWNQAAQSWDTGKFIYDYYDEIAANIKNFGAEYTDVLDDTIVDIGNAIRSGGDKIKAANDGLVDDFLIVPQSLESYEGISAEGKNFVTDWIKNSSQFKVDENQTKDIALKNRDKIIDMINFMAGEDFTAELDGKTISGQDLLDQIYNFDLESVNWQEYKVKADSFVRAMWDAIGGEKNSFGMKPEDLMNIFGFNFNEMEAGWQTTFEQIASHTDMAFEDVRKMLGNEMNAKQVDAFFQIKWNEVDWDNVKTKEDIMNIVNKKAQELGSIHSVKTYSVLVSGVESYNEVLSQTSEIVSDNTEVTKEYKDSLIDIGISEEELADCFDENNGLIVKNAALLNKLVKQKKQDKQATIQQAKAYGQLQYKTTINQIGQLVNRMAAEIKATGYVSAATLDNISVLREQLDVIKQTIQQYALLELSLSDAAQAYSDFEAAKQRDAQLTYGDSLVDALSVLNEGFKTGKVGSEAFQYAVKLIVPPEVYENIDNVQERMRAIHDYVDKNPIFADYFTIDEGQISITMDNIKAFLQDGLDDGLGANFGTFIGTIEDFDLAPHIKSVKDLADAYGITEAAALAMLTEFEKYDASWGNIISRLTTTELDRNIEDTTTALEEAINAQEQFIRDGKRIYDENGNYTKEYQEIVNGVTKAYNDLGAATKAAADNAQAYTQVEAILQGMTGELKLSQEQADNLARSLGLIGEGQSITIENGAIKLTQEQLDILNAKLATISENPTTLDIQLASDTIDQQIQELTKKLKGEAYDEEILVGIEAEGEEEIQQTINELTATQDVIKLVYDITPSGEQNDSNLEKLGNWETNGVTITVRADTTECSAEIDAINATEMDEKEVPITTTADEANAEIDSVDNNNIADKKPYVSMQGIEYANRQIRSVYDELQTLRDRTINVAVNYQSYGSLPTGYADGTFHISGPAFASGNVGAPNTEKALVGELGTELLVDPSTGRWHTVGEHGAEFTQVKKGQIIFNHLQTKQLLENGYVTSRGRLQGGGSAFASGTAYGFGIFDPYVGDNDAFKNGSGNWVNPGENAWNDAADDVSDAADDAEQVVDFIEMKLEEIEAIIEKTSTRIANFLDDTTSIKSKDELYDELVKAEKDKSAAYLKAAQKYNVEAAAALSGVPKKYQEMARNGAIAIKDFIGEDQVEIAEKIQEYRDWAAKADEAENGHLEAIAAISAHRVEQLEDIATDFENIVSISKSHSDLLQAEMDLIEESGNRLSESYYEELKKHSQKQLDDMQDERVALQKILDDSVAAGDVIIGSDDWYSMLETIYEVDQEIIDCKTSLEEFQNAINELYWDNFDKLIEEIDNVDSELSNLYDLISDDDKIVDDMGNWTDDGIAALGLLAQQMENAQFKSQEYGDAIAKLKRDYADGLYSTDEYNERLADLTDSQYDAIKSYEDAKDAIVDLNKTRAEAVKKYMQEEIDAYSELIEKKKESLNADKEARDFEKQVQESNKNIVDIERQIAALKGNTSSSAMAQRKRLEAELLKAREELNDLYYDHSVEKQQEALDKELEDYTKNKEDQMDALDEYLEKEEQVIADSFDLIAENTKNIADVLIGISQEYGVSISDTVATPWIKGTNAIGTYQEQLNTSVSATTKNLETLKKQLEDLQTQADKTANSIVNATHSTIVETNDGHQTSIKGYAKGSKSVEYDQWALIDELGEELQLVPNSAGRLDYIKKGTGILNNTLTERLMNLAMDPTSMIENSRPAIGTPGIDTTNNAITIDASVGTLLHVEHLDGSNPAEVSKLVDKAWEKKMQTLNNSIKKFTR